VTTDDPRSLRVIDAETGAELADLGMEVRRKARICRECRFCQPDQVYVDKESHCGLVKADECLAFNSKCLNRNKKADCELWEPKPVAIAIQARLPTPFAMLLGAIFGGAIASLIWILI